MSSFLVILGLYSLLHVNCVVLQTTLQIDKETKYALVMDNKHSFLYLIKQFVKLSRISWKLVRFFSQVCNIVTVLILEAAIITTKIARSSLWFGVT